MTKTDVETMAEKPMMTAMAAPMRMMAAPQARASTAESVETVVDINDVEDVIIDIDDQLRLMLTTQKADGGNSTSVIYTNTATITSLKINAANQISFGESINKTNATNSLAMNLAAVLLQAQKVLLVTDGNFTWNVKSMDIQAAPATPDTLNPVTSYVENTYTPHTYEVHIKNTSINASENVHIEATNQSRTNGTDEADTVEVDTSDPKWEQIVTDAKTKLENADASAKEAVSELTMSNSLFVTVKPEVTKITLENSAIQADDISMNTNTKINVTTRGIGVGLSVNVILADSLVSIKNSTLKAIGGQAAAIHGKPDGTISVLSKSDVNAVANTKAKAKNFGIAVAVVLGETGVKVEGSTLEAKGNIDIASDNHTVSTASAIGQKKNEKQSGIYVGVSVVDNDSYASIIDSTGRTASLKAGRDINITSNRYGTTTTTARSQVGPYANIVTNDVDATITRIIAMAKQSLGTIRIQGKQRVSDSFNDSAVGQKIKGALGSGFSEESLMPEATEEAMAGATTGGIELTFATSDKMPLPASGVTIRLTPQNIEGATSHIWEVTPASTTKRDTSLKPGTWIYPSRYRRNMKRLVI